MTIKKLKPTLKLTTSQEEMRNSQLGSKVHYSIFILSNIHKLDVISIDKTGEHFRVLYDVKGRFVLKAIKSDEANVKIRLITNYSSFLSTNYAELKESLLDQTKFLIS